MCVSNNVAKKKSSPYKILGGFLVGQYRTSSSEPVASFLPPAFSPNTIFNQPLVFAKLHIFAYSEIT